MFQYIKSLLGFPISKINEPTKIKKFQPEFVKNKDGQWMSPEKAKEWDAERDDLIAQAAQRLNRKPSSILYVEMMYQKGLNLQKKTVHKTNGIDELARQAAIRLDKPYLSLTDIEDQRFVNLVNSVAKEPKKFIDKNDELIRLKDETIASLQKTIRDNSVENHKLLCKKAEESSAVVANQAKSITTLQNIIEKHVGDIDHKAYVIAGLRSRIGSRWPRRFTTQGFNSAFVTSNGFVLTGNHVLQRIQSYIQS